jgi:hypothetical protein
VVAALHALEEIVAACPPAPEVAAACAQGLVRRLQQQQQQQAPAASRGGRDDPEQLAAALEVLSRNGSASSRAAAARAAMDTGAVEALWRLGRMPGVAAGSAAMGVLGCLVAAAEPSQRLPEAIVAAGGVEAALAQLRGVAQEEEEREAAGGCRVAALLLLRNLINDNGPSAEECRRRVMAAGGFTPVVQFYVRGMARGGGGSRGWEACAVAVVPHLLVDSDGGLFIPARAVAAVEAGVVPVLLGCLACRDDVVVQCKAAMALGLLAGAQCHRNNSRQLPEPLRGALRPALAALAGLLRSTELPAIAVEVLYALANIAMADKALAAEVVAAGHAVVPQAGGAGGCGAGRESAAGQPGFPGRRYIPAPHPP